MSEYIASPTSRKEIRKLTNTIRRVFGFDKENYFPVMHLLEIGLLQLDKEFNLEILPVDKMTQYGLTFPEHNSIHLREDVYLGAIEGSGFHRFTVAHEIGHYFLHRPGTIALARESSIEKIPAYKKPEWQANTFAGELLAPHHIIEGLSAKEVSLYCGVSQDVAKIQLNTK